jgi:hypothetical protein
MLKSTVQTEAQITLVEAVTNEEKSQLLAKAMFPGKPSTCSVPHNHEYPNQIPMRGEITQEQIRHHINKLSPYKATVTDEIPNVILIECADEILPFLTQIYRTGFTLQTYAEQWKEIITGVLRKPRKPRYNTPKTYRPITLLNTIAKLLTSIVAEDIMHMAETYQLLPPMHFGGCPGCMTTDLLHLLTDTIKAAWPREQVVSVLFLDIKGPSQMQSPSTSTT